MADVVVVVSWCSSWGDVLEGVVTTPTPAPEVPGLTVDAEVVEDTLLTGWVGDVVAVVVGVEWRRRRDARRLPIPRCSDVPAVAALTLGVPRCRRSHQSEKGERYGEYRPPVRANPLWPDAARLGFWKFSRHRVTLGARRTVGDRPVMRTSGAGPDHVRRRAIGGLDP